MKKLILILLLFPFMMFGAQPENKKFCDTLTIELNKVGQHYITAPNIKIEKCNIDHNQRQVSLVLSDAAGNLPIREEIVDTLRQTIKNLLPIANQKYKIDINTRGVSIEYLIPNYYKSDNIDDERVVKTNANKVVTWVNNLSRPYRISRGLSNRYIALWQSHGRYFNQSSERWEWQRCRLFETVEDLYTQSYVLPFLVPMLENAGAYVVMPRERALQTEEYIIDNDTSLYTKGYYKERNGDKKWSSARNGFAHIQSFYIDGQ
ncbi:MAG: xanthan lyase, partial [Bacteroidales bacterium]